jgi:transposase
VCDNYSGYKASFAQNITEIDCAAPARRKFFDLHVDHQSEIARDVFKYFCTLYETEDEAGTLDPHARRDMRKSRLSSGSPVTTSHMLGATTAI